MNPYDLFTLINAGEAMYTALPEGLREEADRGVQAHIAARAEAEALAKQVFEREYGPGGLGRPGQLAHVQLEPHLYAAIDQSKMIRKGYLTKEDTDRAVLLTGGILAGGVLVILGGLVWKAVRKSDETDFSKLPSMGTGAGIQASRPSS